MSIGNQFGDSVTLVYMQSTSHALQRIDPLTIVLSASECYLPRMSGILNVREKAAYPTVADVIKLNGAGVKGTLRDYLLGNGVNFVIDVPILKLQNCTNERIQSSKPIHLFTYDPINKSRYCWVQ